MAASATTERSSAVDNGGYSVEQLKVKNFLDKFGIKDYELVTLKLSDIDREESLKNQARVSDPLIPEAVERYATAMRKGDAFPPIITFKKPPRQKAPHNIIIDGNQRTAAADLVKANTIDAFVVSGLSDRDITVLTFASNIEHGVASTEKDRMVHAQYLVESTGYSAAESARMLGLSEKKVQQMMQIRNLDRRLVNLNIAPGGLTPRIKDRLSALRSDVILIDAVDFIREYQVDDYEFSPIVTKINKKRSEQDQLEVLVEERAIRGRAKKASTPEPVIARSLNTALGRLLNLDPEKFENSKMSDEYKDNLLQRLTDAAEHLKALRKYI